MLYWYSKAMMPLTSRMHWPLGRPKNIIQRCISLSFHLSFLSSFVVFSRVERCRDLYPPGEYNSTGSEMEDLPNFVDRYIWTRVPERVRMYIGQQILGFHTCLAVYMCLRGVYLRGRCIHSTA